MTTSGVPSSAAAATSAGGAPQIELSTSPPAPTAARNTPGLKVSTETIACGAAARIAASAGSSRPSSVASSIGRLPGRVDSAPTSMMSAPSANAAAACAAAAAGSGFPSPENESGETLTIPIRYVRAPHGRTRPRTRNVPRTAAPAGLDIRDDVGDPPSAQRRDDERRAGHDDDVVRLGVAP